MNIIKKIQGQVIPLARNDVDTDLIIPAQYLTSISTKGYGKHLFQRLRESDENFVFNLPKYQKANILITQDNFGCGSSREHAVWALKESGIEVIIAVSFADIFANNSAKNGLVLIKQPEDKIRQWILSATEADLNLTVDVENKIIIEGEIKTPFELDTFHHHCFVNGLDELDYIINEIEGE